MRARAVAAAGLWFWAVSAAAQQCTETSQVSNQTYSSGTHCFSHNTALTTNGTVTINNSAFVKFVAGGTIQLLPGFRATAPTTPVGTTFQAWVETVPSAVSVTPASGTGMSGLFTFVSSSPYGYAALGQVFALFHTNTTSMANSCFIRYDRNSNLLSLADDGAATWQGGYPPGNVNTMENSQCKVHPSGSSVTAAGNQLSVAVQVTFKTAFTGAKNSYLRAYDNDGVNSGWQQMGVWTVGSAAAPVITNLTPGAGAVGTQVTLAGNNFGASPGSSTVQFYNGVTATTVRNWSNTSVTVDAPSGAATGAVTVTVGGVTSNGWNFTVQTAQPAVSCAATPNPSVAGQTVTFSASVSGGAPPFSFQWSGAVSGTQSTASFAPAAAGTYTANIQITDALARTATNSCGVAVNAPTIVTTITTSPAGLKVTVDNVDCNSTPCTYSWAAGTPHTIATAIRQLPYYFSYWSDNGHPSHAVVAGSFTTFTAYFELDAVTALQKCLSPSGSSVCTLAQGQHTVTNRIEVTRANVTITGESADRSQNVLVRGTNNQDQMMLVNVPRPAQNLLIQNLTFCGGSILSTPASACPPLPQPPVQTKCAEMQVVGKGICSDLQISQADTRATEEAAYPGDPWSYTGPYSVTISNCAFEGSAGHAISLYPTAPQQVNDVKITGCAVNSAEVTGLLVGVGGVDYTDHRICLDEYPDFKNDKNVYAPRNIVVVGNKDGNPTNGFRNNLTGALGINAARWFALLDNRFQNNYFAPRAGNEVGGTVFFNQCTDTVRIRKNWLSGPVYPKTNALELWGRDIEVGNEIDGNQGNTVENYPSDGIGLNSTLNAKVGRNVLQNNGNGEGGTGGIHAWTRVSDGACDPIPRDLKLTEIKHNTSTNDNIGLFVGEQPGSTNVIDGIAVENNGGGARVDAYVTLTGQVSGLPVKADPEPEQSAPRALPVTAEKDLVGAPRIVPKRCLTPGRQFEVFTFPASDVKGAANVFSLQGALRYIDDSYPWPGDPARSCVFYFEPPPNLGPCGSSGCGALYLAADSGVFDWGDSSVVGPGGGVLQNSTCKIHAGHTESKVEGVGNVLKLKLSIEFRSTNTLHMYTTTQNRDWEWAAERYSGWWSPINP